MSKTMGARQMLKAAPIATPDRNLSKTMGARRMLKAAPIATPDRDLLDFLEMTPAEYQEHREWFRRNPPRVVGGDLLRQAKKARAKALGRRAVDGQQVAQAALWIGSLAAGYLIGRYVVVPWIRRRREKQKSLVDKPTIH